MALGLDYVLLGGSARWATTIFAIFVTARLLHNVAYLRALQSWRTVFFLAGMLATVMLMGSVLGVAFPGE